MLKRFPRRVKLFIFLFIIITSMVLGFATYQYREADNHLEKLIIQMDKMFSTASLQQNLIFQAFYMRGYMLYGSSNSLYQFRYYSEINQKSFLQLYDIVRPERKELAKKILESHKKYTRICEEDIIPKIKQGSLEEAVRISQETNAFLMIEECLKLVNELEMLRTQDTIALFGSVINQTREIILKSSAFILLVLFLMVIFSSFITGRAALDNYTYRLVLNATQNGIIIVKRNGGIYLFNRVAEAIFGVCRKKVSGKKFHEVFAGHGRPGEIDFSFPFESVLSSGAGLCSQERVYIDREGWKYNLIIDCLPLKENGNITGVLFLIRDKTEEKIVEEKLKGLAVRDSMTGLYNHGYLKQTLKREIDRVTSTGGLVSFMILDVDNFKYYNDSFGHLAGDEVLKKTALIIEQSVRGSDIVGRYGGDEFAVVLPDADHTSAAEVGERVRSNIENYLYKYSNYMPEKRITVSVGVACYPLQTKSASELIKLADEAMYRAKRTSKNKVEIYTSVIEELMDNSQMERRIAPHMWTLLQAMKGKDPYTSAHSENVARFSLALAQKARLDSDVVSKIKIAAFLHDLGKVELPLEILIKEDPLTPDEWAQIRRHSELGAHIVRQIKQLEEVVPLILHHHERYDGSGYPCGLSGDDIPLGSRVIAIADAFDAITSYRAYRPAKTDREALMEIEKGAGRQFDSHLSRLFINMFNEKTCN